jgi:hypothetical protein
MDVKVPMKDVTIVRGPSTFVKRTIAKNGKIFYNTSIMSDSANHLGPHPLDRLGELLGRQDSLVDQVLGETSAMYAYASELNAPDPGSYVQGFEAEVAPETPTMAFLMGEKAEVYVTRPDGKQVRVWHKLYFHVPADTIPGGPLLDRMWVRDVQVSGVEAMVALDRAEGAGPVIREGQDEIDHDATPQHLPDVEELATEGIRLAATKIQWLRFVRNALRADFELRRFED